MPSNELGEGTGRDPDDPRYPFDYTEWWVCDNCVAQWYVPEDIKENPDECPYCGHSEMTLKDSVEDERGDGH